MEDGALVEMKGSLSTTLVKNLDSLLYEPSIPITILEIGSSPAFTILVNGFSFI